jgi:hypothetical protein
VREVGRGTAVKRNIDIFTLRRDSHCFVWEAVAVQSRGRVIVVFLYDQSFVKVTTFDSLEYFLLRHIAAGGLGQAWSQLHIGKSIKLKRNSIRNFDIDSEAIFY